MFMRDKRIDDYGSEREAMQIACGPKAVWCRVSPSSDQKRKGQAIDCSRLGLELREIVI